MIYVYAITEAPTDALAVEHDGLAAVYAEVDAVPGQTQEAFLEHESVVESVMAAGPALPLRFGTTVDSTDDLRALLAEQGVRFRRLLDSVRGCVEVNVRARDPEAARQEPFEALARASAPTGNGTAYLVAAGDVPAFAERVRAAQADQPDADLSCTGPWPPYSFMGVA